MNLLFQLKKVLHGSCLIIGVCSTFFLVFVVSAQEKEDKHKSKPQQKYAGMSIGNDILNSTDRYLTQTTTFWFDWQSAQEMPFYQFLPAVKNHVGESWRLALKQDIYTPDVKETSDSIKLTDHPFSANLFLSISKRSWNEEQTVQKVIVVSLGVTGAAALGGEIQNFVHELTPSLIVKGWQYQHPGRMYWGVTWEQMYKLWSNSSNSIALYPVVKGAVGSVKNYGRLGLYSLFGDFGPPIGLKPFGNAKYNNAIKSKQLAFESYLGIEGMAYDGNIQSQSNQWLLPTWEVSLEPWRLHGYLGMLGSYSNFQVGIRQYFITKQFVGGFPHKWVEFTFCMGI